MGKFYDELIADNERLRKVSELAAEEMRKQMQVLKEISVPSTPTTTQPKVDKNPVLSGDTDKPQQEQRDLQTELTVTKEKLRELISSWVELNEQRKSLQFTDNMSFAQEIDKISLETDDLVSGLKEAVDFYKQLNKSYKSGESMQYQGALGSMWGVANIEDIQHQRKVIAAYMQRMNDEGISYDGLLGKTVEKEVTGTFNKYVKGLQEWEQESKKVDAANTEINASLSKVKDTVFELLSVFGQIDVLGLSQFGGLTNSLSIQLNGDDIDSLVEKLLKYSGILKQLPEGNQTPLSSPTQSNAGEEARETAQEIEQADEQIENADEEVIEAEEKVAQTTAESREKASNAAKKHAKETKQASEEVLAALRQLEEEQKRVYSDEDFSKRDIVSQSGLKETHQELGQDGKLHTVGSFSFLERLQDGELQRVLVSYEEATGEWYEKVLGVSTAFEQVGKEIISLDDKIKQYEMSMDKQKAAHPTYDTSADERLIALAKERQAVLLDTLGFYHDEEEYAYKMNEFEEKRARNQERLQALTEQNSNLLQAKAEEKATKAAEQHAEAIAKANRHLNTQEKKLEQIERKYNKAINPDLEKSVTNQNDLAELEKKKNEILALIAKLKNSPRDASNEQDYLDLEKMIAAYKDLADSKKRANNPTKGELGGQDLKTALVQQINEYKKLIEHAETFGDKTSDNVRRLKEQLEIISATDSQGVYTADAQDYYKARNVFKEERSNISYIESQNKGTFGEIDEISEALKHLINTEETYQKLLVKRDLKSLSPEEAKRLAELTESRQRDNAVLEKSISLTKEQQALQDEYSTKKSDVSVGIEAYRDTLIGEQLKSYTKFYDSIEANKRNLTPVVEYKQKIDELQTSITKLQNMQNDGIDITNSKELAEVKELIVNIETLQQELRNMKNNVAFQELDTEEANKKLADLYRTLEKNTKMSKELRTEFKALAERYNIAINTKASQKDLEELNAELAELQMRLQASGKTGNSFFNLVGKKITGMAAQFFAMYLSFQDLLRIGRQAYQYVLDIDKQMIELEKVSDMSTDRLAQSFEHAAVAAKDLGATISDVISATADWSRLGFNADQAEKLAEVAILYKNVGDGIDISTANESLISTLQGFQLDASEAESVVDKFNEVAKIWRNMQ